MKKIDLINGYYFFVEDEHYDSIKTELDQVLVLAILYDCYISIEHYTNEEGYCYDRSQQKTLQHLNLDENEEVKIFSISFPKKETHNGRRSYVLFLYSFEDSPLNSIWVAYGIHDQKRIREKNLLYETLLNSLVNLKELL